MEAIVVYKNEVGKKEVLEEIKNVEYEFETIPAVSVTATEEELENIESNPNISYVEENTTFSISETGSVNSYVQGLVGSTQWNISATNVQSAWAEGYTGQGVKVAVLDTGISNHIELNISGGVSTVDYTRSWNDDNGHGTHVAGIIGSQPGITSINGIDITGVAPDVNLYAVKVLSNTGFGNLLDILEGIDWAIANDMDIINLSFTSATYSQIFEQMINNAYQKGILIVAASGNDGLNSTVRYPARFNNVIAISSVDNSLTISNFSSIGDKIDFAAPGDDILSTHNQGDYVYESGTSQATPHVSGILALLKEKYPDYTNSELQSLLRGNSKDLGIAGKDPYYGYGLIYYNSNVGISDNPSIYYSTHVQSYGWMEFVSNGDISGTEGKAKRLEAIKVDLKHAPYNGDIVYSTHVQDYGWLDEVSNGKISGTTGENKRLEAIRIYLTGEMAYHYDVYYRVHVQDYGWLDWAKNGQASGTAGLEKRLVAIEIVLVEKDGPAPGTVSQPFVVAPSVSFSTHVQTYGWMSVVTNGALSGTEGESKRLEAIRITLNKAPYRGGIIYSTHVQDYGWLTEVSNGKISGTVGESKRLEAIQIRLTGEVALHYDVYYRVHVQDFGWLDWLKNGATAGTSGQSKRLEAIEIKLIEK
ncbi:S8 family serine peptidase [Caldifermentibacillus hisashii]|uniref:S8 family serine peptidase n=1 Tax=Caldifermentibacillus hisashii TaxID=996558 RepID=UPI002E1F021F|nr:S8 family serine peptidase [Caldifermentibacillus hisashii]MED3644681.1 S8 family serine peptidase [Caldifermentibacillus hisashii]